MRRGGFFLIINSTFFENFSNLFAFSKNNVYICTERKFEKFNIMENKYNGFASEEQYLEAFEKFKSVQEREDIFDRDTIALYKDEDRIVFHLDKYAIAVWGNSVVEVFIDDEKNHLVDGGIIDVCRKLREMQQEGEFDVYFQED